MRNFYFVLILILFASLYALEFNVVEFRELPSDFHAQMESELDLDMEYCTVLRIESDIPSELSLKQKIYKKEIIQPGEYYFYITHKEKSITFEAPEYLPLTVNVPQSGFKKGVVYYLRLESIREVQVTKTIPEPEIESETQSNIKFERYGVVFELVSCEMFDNTIIIKLQITSINNDCSVKILHGSVKLGSRLFDDLGNEYKPSTLKFANKSKNRSVKNNLVAKITSPASLIFKKVNKNATLVPLFNLGIWMKESGNFRVSFRDIPINKKD